MSTHSSPCLLCGCHYLFTDNNDPDSISDDIERLDRAIYSLPILKSQRCRQLNAVRSLTKTLPNEILLYVFQLFCSLFKSQDFPQFILGGVCNRWRDLVNSAPLFWKTMNLQIRNLRKAGSLLQMFKERNGASFEFIQLKFERLHGQTNPPFQRLLQSLKGVSRLQRIALHNPPVELLPIINSDLDIRNVSLAGPSSLTHELNSVSGFSLPWSTLTILKLSRIRINICCDLLLGCPNLIQFSSYDPSEPPLSCMRPNTHQTRETCFPHLQHLTWYHNWSEWDDNLLLFYRFPALQHFHWCGGRHHYSSFKHFHDFTSSLPPVCRISHLSATAKYDVHLEEGILLQIEHPIEQLICSDFNISTLSVALDRLDDRTFIPSLTFFKWENRNSHYIPEERIPKLTQEFNRILCNRNEIGVGRFRMEIGGLRLRSEPDKCDREKIYELMDSDWFDFEIAENGNWIMSF